jgi:hypothetical protein
MMEIKMKRIIGFLVLGCFLAIPALAQEGDGKAKVVEVDVTTVSTATQDTKGKAEATRDDKLAAIPSDSYLKRGAPIGKAEKASLESVMKDPAKYAGKTVLVEGVIVRSCKTEGCWAELAPKADAKSVRVKMKDHSFFIPLESAGAMARAEGVFSVKTLTKAQVDHMINDDGAKIENRNADGTVSEISFEAAGIELKRPAK